MTIIKSVEINKETYPVGSQYGGAGNSSVSLNDKGEVFAVYKGRVMNNNIEPRQKQSKRA